VAGAADHICASRGICPAPGQHPPAPGQA
jgi:hypothetical protein